MGSAGTLLIALVVVAPPVLAQVSRSSTTVPVPGGAAALARLLGPVDDEPDELVSSLNALLLGATSSDHDWRAVEPRRDLVRFLEVVDDLR